MSVDGFGLRVRLEHGMDLPIRSMRVDEDGECDVSTRRVVTGRRAPVTRTQLLAAARNIANTAYVLEIAHGSQHPMVSTLLNREAEALEEAKALHLVDMVYAGGLVGQIAAAELAALNAERMRRQHDRMF